MWASQQISFRAFRKVPGGGFYLGAENGLWGKEQVGQNRRNMRKTFHDL